MRRLRFFLFNYLLLFASTSAQADQIHLAVASNFRAAMQTLVGQFEEQSHHRIVLSFGSTGKHYAQIQHGAPFDAFFAADIQRPTLLEQQGRIVTGSRFTYAIGKLVLWSPLENYIDTDGNVLAKGTFTHLALANPKLAPYGRAAQQVLQARGLWDSVLPRLVRGENIAQTYQYIKSGNAQLGFVAYSQVVRADGTYGGSLWQIPQSLYSPIEQQAVVLKESPAISEFIAFVKSEQALKIIHNYGYDTP